VKKIIHTLVSLLLLVSIIGCSKDSGPEKLSLGKVTKSTVVSQGSLGYVWVNELGWSEHVTEIFVGTNQTPNGTFCVYREMLIGKRPLGFVDVRVSDIDFLNEVDRNLNGESYKDERDRKIRQLEKLDLGPKTNRAIISTRGGPGGFIAIEPAPHVRDKSRDQNRR
jgi:hypothetical protein